MAIGNAMPPRWRLIVVGEGRGEAIGPDKAECAVEVKDFVNSSRSRQVSPALCVLCKQLLLRISGPRQPSLSWLLPSC